MKLKIRDDRAEQEQEVELWLEKDGDTSALFYARDRQTGSIKRILRLCEDGKIVRCACANIGDFKFDDLGRIIIE